MSIGPVMQNAAISRTQDYTTIKQNEDQKPVFEQNNIQANNFKETNIKQHQVHDADDSDQHEYQYDAKEKGNGGYSSNQNNKKKEEKGNEKPMDVKLGGGTFFDIKI